MTTTYDIMLDLEERPTLIKLVDNQVVEVWECPYISDCVEQELRQMNDSIVNEFLMLSKQWTSYQNFDPAEISLDDDPELGF
ncbi:MULTISPECIES: hypothetical protein [unclassified Coleofasciculus]|uniref:hypothetical protein n=1 Tax=unclassified Coleofasciculus TaxID=2692782 RepID=UPI00187EFB2D|nr:MULTISPECIES: hypothetical protein [unclassified Coleofasciculus]MBE9128013.1 hypothetical protein [Coleofasciculus sp. LEGE 07081]